MGVSNRVEAMIVNMLLFIVLMSINVLMRTNKHIKETTLKLYRK